MNQKNNTNKKKLLVSKATDKEIDLIDKGASIMKQSRSAFLLWSSVKEAKRLIENET